MARSVIQIHTSSNPLRAPCWQETRLAALATRSFSSSCFLPLLPPSHTRRFLRFYAFF